MNIFNVSYAYLLLQAGICILAINHFVLLKENARIEQKVDSPFFLREPENLIAFLEQINYNDYVETTYLELLRQREKIIDHILSTIEFTVDLVDQSECVMEYYMLQTPLLHTQFTRDYIKRFELLHQITLRDKSLIGEPTCANVVKLSAGPCCYDHLDSFQTGVLYSARMELKEEIHIGELGIATDIIRKLALEGLMYHPKSWEFHTLSSYYWRLRNEPQKALECARRGVMLASRQYKDIPLLSLGTILLRIGRLADAAVILAAAVDHANNVSVNHVALASVMALRHEFNRSLYHFDEAERIDATNLIHKTTVVKNLVSCLNNHTKNTARMYSYLEYVKNELREFKQLKQKVLEKQEKLLQQQIPLGARYVDSKTNNEDLLKRGQYCSTRTLAASEEPVLFCDFYSDMQMRLDSEDIKLESLERHLKITTEDVIRQVYNDITKKLNIEKMQQVQPEVPPPLKLKVNASELTPARDKNGRS